MLTTEAMVSEIPEEKGEGGGRMVTVAKWRDGAIAEEYIWS